MGTDLLIAMVADYSFDVKNIDIWAPAFFKHINSFIATVVAGSDASDPHDLYFVLCSLVVNGQNRNRFYCA